MKVVTEKVGNMENIGCEGLVSLRYLLPMTSIHRMNCVLFLPHARQLEITHLALLNVSGE
jgi:hypothetical protein